MDIKKIIFDGIESLEIINGDNRMLITVECGPRIAFFGKVDGKNILYWDKEGYQRGEWRLYGGHRVWLTRPMADESEDTYLPDNARCEYEVLNDKVVIKTPIASNGIVRGMEIKTLANGQFEVVNFISNKSNLLYSAGVWSPTCINPEGEKRFAISLGTDESSWDIVKIAIPRKFGGNIIPLNDEQISFNNEFMLINPKGKVSKRCVYSAKGQIAMTSSKDKLTFIKTVKSKRNGKYQMDGCNMAIFIGQDNFMVEMETYGEEQALYPEESLRHSETWILIDEAIDFEIPDIIDLTIENL